MSENVNEINKISVDSSLEIKNVNMTMLLFSDNLLSPKTGYTIADNMLILKDQAQSSLNLFQFTDSSRYYEYLVNLRISDAVISGIDRYGNRLSNLSGVVLVFVNGYKLSSSEYEIDVENETITIPSCYTEKMMSNVIIYTSSDLVYEGNVEDDFSWDSNTNEFTLKDYSIERYVFFKNGELLPPNKIQKIGNHVRLNTIIKHGVDFVEYYRMTKGYCALTFTPSLGYLTYGPKDDRGTLIQNPYDCIISFNNVAKLVVDNIRPGFFVYEDGTDGCVMITDDDFEKRDLKCLIIKEFHNSSLSSSEYFLTVPNAPSILKYVSEYDLNGTLFKELLASFQKVLLNETYDTVQRLKDIRNINKVDSSNINALINFLGLKINVTNLTLAKKHNLIEELRSFYNVVGTRASYNFYNGFKDKGKILNIEQLFTPIKSNVKEKNQQSEYEEIYEGGEVSDPIRRYVTFRTAEELGAVEKRKFVTDSVDFGQVSELAVQGGVNLSNTPRYEGVLKYSDYPVLINGTLDRYHPTDSGPVLSTDSISLSIIVNSIVRMTKVTNDNDYEMVVDISAYPLDLRVELHDRDGRNLRVYGYVEETNTYTFLLEESSAYHYNILDKNGNKLFSNNLEYGDHTVTTTLPLVNNYITDPKMGPNEATIDCGYITEEPVDFYDFGSVSDDIPGHWVTWYEWDRPKNWYPTNHVDVSVNIPVDMDYETFMNIFKDTFYDMASAVLYIHQIAQIYMFGDPNNDGSEPIQPMSLITTLPYTVETQCFTNDHEFLPYKKAVSNKPLKELKAYMFKNPTYEFVESYSNNITGTSINLKEFFPEEWGKLNEVKQTVAPNETNDGYLFTWSLHFDNGTLPVVVDKNTLVPNWNLTLFTNDTNPLLNGCCYRKGEWINSVASDEGDYMLWKKSDGSSIRSLNYISADNMNWYVYNNKITVHSHKFNFTITEDLLVIGDIETKTNKSLKVSVDLYKNYGRDEDLYNQTGEERDIEWTETLTGIFPCEQLNYTYWSSQQDESTMPVSGNVSYEKATSIPMFTVTCTPNENRTSLLYALVINYDDREEAYIIDKTLQIVTKLNVPSQIKKLQTVIDDEIVYVRPNSVFYENGTWSLGYLTYDEEFDTFKWKAPTLNNDYPQDEHELLDTGLGGFILENASSYNWNGGKWTNPIVDSRSEVRNAKLYISIDIGEDPYIYKEINSAFDLNEYVGEYSKPYSYSHNNVTWSCDLTKYKVYNTVTLKDSSIETNASTLLLPTNILYSDGNNGLNYSFQNPPPYTFSTLEPHWNQVGEESTEIEDKEYWKYTNNFATVLNGTTLTFSTYGIVLVSNEIVIRNVDYVVLKYRWFSGKDLDSWTYITNAIGSMASSINNIKVGFGTGNQYVPSQDNYLLWWGGDNTGTGEENILLNIKNMKDYYSEYIPELLNIEMDACWFSIVSQTQPIIEVTGYKGGTMSQSGYQFVNNGGEMVSQQTIQAVNMSTTTTHEYRNVANVKYNKDTETFTLTITDRYEETTPDLDEVANLLGE